MHCLRTSGAVAHCTAAGRTHCVIVRIVTRNADAAMSVRKAGDAIGDGIRAKVASATAEIVEIAALQTDLLR